MRLSRSSARVRRRRRRPALVAAVAAVGIVVGLLAVPAVQTAAAAPTPPPNPSDGQINSAAAEKAAVANQVGELNAQIASIKTQIAQKQALAELAEQKYAYALQKLDEANQAAAAAKAKVKSAQQAVDTAQADFRYYVQTTYMSGDLGGTTGSLLTASDPNVLLQESALRDYQADHQLDVISQLQSATVGKSNANAAARQAVKRQQAATKAAADAKQQADDAVITAQAQEQELQSSLADKQAALLAAQEHLATLNNQRAAFIKWKKHQEYLAHQRWLKKQAALKRARELEKKREEELRRQQEQQRRQHQHQDHGGGSSGGGSSGGGSSGGGGGSSSNPPPIHPTGGGWTQSKGWAAVARAKKYLGWMYAWAGGNAYGPTRGICAGDGAWNDCHVVGFDCSGLTLYAWAPYERLDHFSVTQYYQAGSFHPSTNQLQPGDLVFWSANGSVSGIHHVALYIGGGMVIQAPQSGEVIQETPLGSVSWGYYGATRPLT